MSGYQTVDYEPISGSEDTPLFKGGKGGSTIPKNEKQVFMVTNENATTSTKTLYQRIFTKLHGIIFVAAVVITVCLGVVRVANSGSSLLNTESPPTGSESSIDAQGRYIMRNYDLQKPMANFLNGIAGQWGVPMWAFYINRGQGITSFGKQNKDGGISKFLTAEKAYQQSAFTGFRTILKGKRAPDSNGDAESWNYMPFNPRSAEDIVSAQNDLSKGASPLITRNMMIGLNEFEIEEVHRDKGLQTNVVYFSMPSEDFPSLVRMTTLTNLDADRALDLEVLDGLARLVPSGLNNGDLDSMGRTMEAWMNVYNVGSTETTVTDADVAPAWSQPAVHSATEATSLRGTPVEGTTVPVQQRVLQSKGYNIVQPFFHISQGTADTAQIQIIKDGHFVLSFILQDVDEVQAPDGLYPLLPFIVDPNVVFKYDTTLTSPTELYAHNVSTLLSRKQCTTSRTPCAYSSVDSITLAPNSNVTIISVYGHSTNLEQFISTISPKLRGKDYVLNKREEARQLIIDITSKVATNTSSAILNQYIKQNFLDNLLRGGLPILLGGSRDNQGSDGEVTKASANNNDDTPANRLLGERREEPPRRETPKPTVKTTVKPTVKPTSKATAKATSKATVPATASATEKASDVATPVTTATAPAKTFNDNTFQPKVFHTFSRIHGDIERDYNFFQIDTTYYSQGPGNFRDVAQNRRSDVSHTPEVEDFNIVMFLSFVQADGYNPLTVAGTNFKIPAALVDSVIKFMNISNPVTDYQLVSNILSNSFRPGQLFRDIRAAGITYSVTREALLAKVILVAEQTSAAQYAQNGFWTDHWTYTLDLVDNYLSVYPDYEEALLFRSAPIPFYMSPAYVKTRAARYSLVNNDNSPGTDTVRMYNAVTSWGDADFSPERVLAMNAIFTDKTNYNVDSNGAGNVWQRNADSSVATVNVFSKLLILGMLKYSTMDSQGMGVEMEGGKPGWNDAMNGLPGLIGSGMPETYEMLRIVRYLTRALKRYQASAVVHVPAEFHTFLLAVVANLDAYNSEAKTATFDVTKSEFTHWDHNNLAREQYRASVVATFSGQTSTLTADLLLSILAKVEVKVNAGIARAIATRQAIDATTANVLSPTYFYYECTDFTMLVPTKVTIPAQATQVAVKAFNQHALPLFLEGPTRHLKVVDNVEDRRAIYTAVKASALYDKALSMYKLSAPLVGVDQTIGRLMAFSPGWLENQSIWLHMSYKFYLELLRGELYDEFYTEISTGLAPFMDPLVYGRSPLEAASFVVSSQFPDASLHGAGYLARLSGSTAEFLSMWSLMMVGETPFSTGDDKAALTLTFAPKLPAWLFNADNTLSFTFLGSVKVTYINPSAQNTWGLTVTSITLRDAEGQETVVQNAYLEKDLALRVRNLEFTSIDVAF